MGKSNREVEKINSLKELGESLSESGVKAFVEGFFNALPFEKLTRAQVSNHLWDFFAVILAIAFGYFTEDAFLTLILFFVVIFFSFLCMIITLPNNTEI